MFKNFEGKAHFTPYTSRFAIARLVQGSQGGLWPTERVQTSPEATWRTQHNDQILVTPSNRHWTCVWHSSLRKNSPLYGGAFLCTYLAGTGFTFWTDYDALKWTIDLADANGKLAWSWLRLCEIEVYDGHRAGIKHQVAVAFSWVPTTGEDCNPVNEALLVMSVSSTANALRKGCIKTTRSTMTAMRLPPLLHPPDYPPYAQIKRQGWTQPHQR